MSGLFAVLGSSVLLLFRRSQFVLRHADPMIINQQAPQKCSASDQQRGEQRQVKPPGQDRFSGISQARQPVERSDGYHHHGQNGMAPGSDQAAYFLDQHQIQRADDARDPATEGAGTGQPHAHSSPEGVLRPDVGEVGKHHGQQQGYRKVDQLGVDRMAKERHLASDSLLLHRVPQRLLNGMRRYGMSAKSLAAFVLLGVASQLAGCAGELSILDPAGPAATASSLLWWGMFGFFSLVLIVVVGLWFYAMRRDPGDLSHQDAQRIQNRWVFWGGLVLPSVSIITVLAFGLPVGHTMLPTPPDEGEAVQINVQGHQWWFEVSYPGTGIALEDQMFIPAGVPIDVHLTSADVIHSFWVPRLAGKLDMVPGHTNVLRIEADKPGTYRGVCAEFCGRDHAHMSFVVEALEPGEYEAWLEETRANE